MPNPQKINDTVEWNGNAAHLLLFSLLVDENVEKFGSCPIHFAFNTDQQHLLADDVAQRKNQPENLPLVFDHQKRISNKALMQGSLAHDS